MSPIIANRPFHFSALEEKIGLDLDSTVTPLNMGTRDAPVKIAAVIMNHWTPPNPICVARSSPVKSSTAKAVVNPSIARRPLIVSGAGPAKENTSKKFVLTLGFTGDGGVTGKGVAVVGVTGVMGVAGVTGLLCSGSAMHFVSLDTRELCRTRLLWIKETLETLLTPADDIAVLATDDAAIVIAPIVIAISDTRI
jgi:hypothetical protein